jgi:hypothetical protein
MAFPAWPNTPALTPLVSRSLSACRTSAWVAWWLAGLLLAGAGVRFVYWMDVASWAAAIAAAAVIAP